eukprot:COSAG05_NODE_28095_length_134_cov_25.000000_1_plen_38_part_10
MRKHVYTQRMMSYQRQMCRARTRVLVNAGRHPIFVLGP